MSESVYPYLPGKEQTNEEEAEKQQNNEEQEQREKERRSLKTMLRD